MIHIPVSHFSKAALLARYEAMAPHYQVLLEQCRGRIERVLKEHGLRATVKSRYKSFESFFSKVLFKAREQPQATVVLISDLLGLRVVCPFMEDTRVVEDLVRRTFTVVERERKGDEFSPREFGYESTHLLIDVEVPPELHDEIQDEVLCELQIRTILQDAWAEVEHELMYKNEFTPFDEPLRRKLAAVNANLSLSDIIFQEIRDYQRRFQTERRRRRKSFLEKMKEISEASVRGKEEQPLLLEGFVSPLGESVDELLLSALSLHNRGDYTGSAELYTRILGVAVKSSIKAVVLIHRGMAFFAAGRYGEAIDDFTLAITLDAGNPRAYYYRGVVYRFMHDSKRALDDFDKTLNIDPYQFDPLFNRAQVFFGLGDNIRALEDCSRALGLKPDVKEAQLFLEVVKRRLQR